jgi:hypothetical protein
MNAAELRERINDRLLREIDELDFPSVAMLDRVESALDDRGALASYTEVLVKKVEATQFPSVALLNRLDRLIARLDAAERAQAERAESAA